MRKTLRAKYIAPEIHALLFISMWVLYSVFSPQPLLNGPSALPFAILFVADLPLSLVAFGVMFSSDEKGMVAAVLWGVLGTLWWFLIGFAIDARSRKKRVVETEQVPANATANSEANYSRRRELLIAVSAVAMVVAASTAWQWNGRQGHFDKGEIGQFAFAPDGRSIVLVRWQGDSSLIENVDLVSGTSTPVGKAIPCRAHATTFSPDAKQIAFACESNPGEYSRILIMDADGANLHPLFPSNPDNYDFAAHFTPDGKEIYVARSGRAATSWRWDLYSASLDGENERPLTEQHFEFFGVSFSGDGRKLVLSGDTTSGTRLSLYSLDDPSKGETTIQPLIPNQPRTPIISNVALAADGRSIYFMAASVRGYDVYRSDLAGNSVDQLTTDNGYATDLCVSRDGKTAVFLRWTSRWGSLPNLGRLYSLDLASKRLTALNVTGAK